VGPSGFYIGRGTVGTGPFPAVTINDAISDLPRKSLPVSEYVSMDSLTNFISTAFEYEEYVPPLAEMQVG